METGLAGKRVLVTGASGGIGAACAIAPSGRGNAVCPGWKVSPMTRSTLEDPSVLDCATRTMALRKAAQPADIARQIVALASDGVSGHVTGQVVVVAGGMEGRLLHG